MTERAIKYGLPLFLLSCLWAGGSVQGIWENLALQIAGLVILAAVAIGANDRAVGAQLGPLRWIALAFVALVLAELIPLPPGLWTRLPGRSVIAEGFDLLGQPRPWLAWSLIPSASIATLFPLLVPTAVLAALVSRQSFRPAPLIGALVIGTMVGVLLGFLQTRSGTNDWYLYRFSAFGQPAGFFANSNHMGTLLLANIPFVAAVGAAQFDARKDVSQRGLVVGMAVALGGILIIASALNRSLAVMLLGGPVLLLSLAIPNWKRGGVRKALLVVAVVALSVSIAVGASAGKLSVAGKESSVATRAEIWANAGQAVQDFDFTGSGLGTFQKVYRHYEDRETVDWTYVNHAHNDYLQLAVELGIPGLVLIGLFLLWWGCRVGAAWRGQGNVYARAASIASAAILVHSLVDFPLRTAAISAVFAMSLGMLAIRMTPARADDRGDLRELRHLTIG